MNNTTIYSPNSEQIKIVELQNIMLMNAILSFDETDYQNMHQKSQNITLPMLKIPKRKLSKKSKNCNYGNFIKNRNKFTSKHVKNNEFSL